MSVHESVVRLSGLSVIVSLLVGPSVCMSGILLPPLGIMMDYKMDYRDGL